MGSAVKLRTDDTAARSRAFRRLMDQVLVNLLPNRIATP